MHTGQMFAMKLQRKDSALKQAHSEVLQLRRFSHPHIVKLVQAFQTPTSEPPP